MNIANSLNNDTSEIKQYFNNFCGNGLIAFLNSGKHRKTVIQKNIHFLCVDYGTKTNIKVSSVNIATLNKYIF